MRIPAFIIEHPLEALIAGVLLLALLFGSADRHAAELAVSPHDAKVAAAATPAPMMAIQGVSFATAASRIRVRSLLAGCGCLRGRDRWVTTAQTSGGTRRTRPATA